MDADDVMELELLENPRRRRHYTAAQLAAGFGGKRHRTRRHTRRHARRHRNPGVHAYSANPRRHRRRVRYGVRHQVYRRNPGGAGVAGTAMRVVKDAAIATAGVQVNNLLGNTIAKQLLKVTGPKRSAIKVATAVLLPVLGGLFVKRYSAALCLAGSSAIALEASKLLNRKVYPSMGDLGNSLSTSDEAIPAGYVAPATAVPRPFGYNSRVRYGPGTHVPQYQGNLSAYVRRLAPANPASFLGMGRIAPDAAGVYDSSPGVY